MVLVNRSIVQKGIRAKNRTDITVDVNCPQHVPHEGQGNIHNWAVAHDEAQYPSLVPEKRVLGRYLAERKLTLNVCLGSQFLEEVLGARVYRNRWKGIGWFPVERCSTDGVALFKSFSTRLPVSQWHGETFELPPGTAQLATSEGYPVQAFEHPYALGVQFHLGGHRGRSGGAGWECDSGIVSGPCEQTPTRILSTADPCAGCTNRLTNMLDEVQQRIGDSGA
jgi:hypothetical protein